MVAIAPAPNIELAITGYTLLSSSISLLSTPCSPPVTTILAFPCASSFQLSPSTVRRFVPFYGTTQLHFLWLTRRRKRSWTQYQPRPLRRPSAGRHQPRRWSSRAVGSMRRLGRMALSCPALISSVCALNSSSYFVWLSQRTLSCRLVTYLYSFGAFGSSKDWQCYQS